MKSLIGGFSSYLQHERNVSPHTYKNYLVDLTQFFQFLEKRTGGFMDGDAEDIGKVDATVIREFMGQIHDAMAPSSIARKIATLRTFFQYCIRKGYSFTNPAREVATPKVPKRLPKFLSVDEVFTLLATPSDASAIGARDKAALELLYASGLRVSELVGLNTEDIDYNGKSVRVFGKGRKERIIPMNDKASEALKKYIAQRTSLTADSAGEKALFVNRQGGRLTARSVERLLIKYIKQCGLQMRVTPHVLRHTFATHLIGQGADMRGIQELLGHASLSTTQKYTQVGVEKLLDTYDKTHPKA